MGMWRNFRSLRAQLVVTYMIISLIVLSAGSYYVYSFMQGQIKEQNERLMLQQFQQIDHNIHGVVGSVDQLSNLFWLDDEVQQLLQNISEKSEYEFLSYQYRLQSRIETFIMNYSYIHSIYLTAEKQGLVGGNANQTLVQTQDVWDKQFFSSDAYKRSQQEFPKLVLQGGIKESYYNPYRKGPNDATLISMLRGVRSVYEPMTSGTLIFNIDERYLASVYATDLKPEDGDMYIVDRNGLIVSSSRPDKVGTTSAFVPQREGGPAYGSRDGKSGGTPVQTVFYKLQDGDWYILKEIPLSSYSNQIYKLQRVIALFFILSLLIMFTLSYFWLRKIMKPLHLLSGKMKDVSRGELGVTFDKVPDNELGTVIRRFNEMSLSIVSLIDKNNEMQEQKRELEIEALQYQINPHFLYNTLNMIRWMASLIKADNIVGSVVALGNMLRPIFSGKDVMCSLRDELHYLDNYIKIINWRFNNSVEFELDAAEDDLEYRVPRFILQPLVENAIASGGEEEEHAIRIRIQAWIEEETLRISVADSGAGLEPGLLEALNQALAAGEALAKGDGSKKGVGLSNVNKRIRLYFGERYGVRFSPVERGAEVIMSLPAVRPDDPA